MSFDAFWLYEKETKKVVSPVHIIKSFHSEENEAGCEGEIYTSYCGEEMPSWFYNTPIQPDFGTLEKAIENGANICGKCFQLKNKIASNN